MKKEQKWQVRLSGSGGQGLILAGIVLAAAGNLENKYVVQTQSYGPEARGGASRAEVIISDVPIDFLEVEEADIFLALTTEAYAKYCYNVASGGMIIVDSNVDTKVQRTRVNAFPIISTARDVLGREIVANIVALGVLTSLSSILNDSSVKEALEKRVPPHTMVLNSKAFEKGWELGKERLDVKEVKKI